MPTFGAHAFQVPSVIWNIPEDEPSLRLSFKLRCLQEDVDSCQMTQVNIFCSAGAMRLIGLEAGMPYGDAAVAVPVVVGNAVISIMMNEDKSFFSKIFPCSSYVTGLFCWPIILLFLLILV